MRLPLSLSLTAAGFFRCRAPPPTNPPPSSPHPRALLPRDCTILRLRAGLLLSRACDSPFAMSFGATRSPSSLRHAVGCCMSASRHVKRSSSFLKPLVAPCLHAACGPISPCCRMHACSLNLSMLLSCLQDDRDPHQLCSGEDDRAQPRDHAGGVSPGWDQDCIGVNRRDDHSLGFWCAGALKIAPPWPKLTRAGLSGRHAGAVEREEERAQPARQVCGVFAGRDEVRVRIVRQDDQSLVFGCAGALKTPRLSQS